MFRIKCQDCSVEDTRKDERTAWRVRRAHARSSGHEVIVEEVDD
ncbi:hypothetical protein [Halomarina litorea]|nr:hypothetical protein [Halomarina sp. BCD28]